MSAPCWAARPRRARQRQGAAARTTSLPFLQAVGWSGSLSGVERWAAWAYDRVDRVTVCLDVGPRSTRIWLGMRARDPTAGRARVARRCSRSCAAAGLCTSENAAAFLACPASCARQKRGGLAGALDRGDAAAPTDPSPRRSAGSPMSSSPCRRAGRSLKGYWGAGHVWREAAPRCEGTSPASTVAAAVAGEALTARHRLPARPARRTPAAGPTSSCPPARATSG